MLICKLMLGILLLQADPAAVPQEQTTPSDSPNAKTMIAMEACQASRPGRFGQLSFLQLLTGKRPEDEPLVKKGMVRVDGEDYTIYLPKADTYAIENTGSSDDHHDNSSTLLAIDHNHDGKFTDDENWYANLPIRLGDRMFDVVEIADNGSTLTLQPSAAPLSGLIVGRKCPPFTYTLPDGKTVSQNDYRGKAFLLDIWSVT